MANETSIENVRMVTKNRLEVAQGQKQRVWWSEVVADTTGNPPHVETKPAEAAEDDKEEPPAKQPNMKLTFRKPKPGAYKRALDSAVRNMIVRSRGRKKIRRTTRASQKG